MIIEFGFLVYLCFFASHRVRNIKKNHGSTKEKKRFLKLSCDIMDKFVDLFY